MKNLRSDRWQRLAFSLKHDAKRYLRFIVKRRWFLQAAYLVWKIIDRINT